MATCRPYSAGSGNRRGDRAVDLRREVLAWIDKMRTVVARVLRIERVGGVM